MHRAWKDTERAIAILLDGKRIPVTGRARGEVPDVTCRWLAVEVKHRRSLPSWLKKAMEQAEAAAGNDQLAIAVLHEEQKRHSEDLVILRLGDFIDWFGR